MSHRKWVGSVYLGFFSPRLCGHSVRRHDVQDVPPPHHRREPPAGPGADGRERPVAERPPTVCQAAAGGGRL